MPCNRPEARQSLICQMDEVDRSRLRQHRVFFVQTVDVRLLFSPLIQDDILTADDCEFIQSQGRTRMEKAEVFLDMIASKGPNAFVSLCRALKPRYGLLLQRLGLAAEELDELEGEYYCDWCSFLKTAGGELKLVTTGI